MPNFAAGSKGFPAGSSNLLDRSDAAKRFLRGSRPSDLRIQGPDLARPSQRVFSAVHFGGYAFNYYPDRVREAGCLLETLASRRAAGTGYEDPQPDTNPPQLWFAMICGRLYVEQRREAESKNTPLR